MPPSISGLFWASIPLIIVAIVYQIGIPTDLVTKLVPDLFIIKIIRNVLSSSTTRCYASVKTLSDDLPTAECFTVSKDGRFSRVFLDDTSFELTKQARTGYVYPGLWDGHGHLSQYGELLHSIDLFGAETMDEVHKRVLGYKASHEEAGSSDFWLRGVGWDQANFGGKWPVAVSLFLLLLTILFSDCVPAAPSQSYFQGGRNQRTV
jgi:hypothetical protein